MTIECLLSATIRESRGRHISVRQCEENLVTLKCNCLDLARTRLGVQSSIQTNHQEGALHRIPSQFSRSREVQVGVTFVSFAVHFHSKHLVALHFINSVWLSETPKKVIQPASRVTVVRLSFSGLTPTGHSLPDASRLRVGTACEYRQSWQPFRRIVVKEIGSIVILMSCNSGSRMTLFINKTELSTRATSENVLNCQFDAWIAQDQNGRECRAAPRRHCVFYFSHLDVHRSKCISAADAMR
ncbi:unnamed protein product [Protopolystoma xenopodis]|uniref:Uncharacterized protein n=1 Tax=Protopolystoma xenopodis TaxID=117903 RepID=A0A448X9W4_9PLAT|nr:unnamed protein product [Protopolystoma xenopodis]